MTCKEKMMKLYPHMDWGKVVVSECPSDYSWLCDPEYCGEHHRDGEFIESVCERCWNREIPGTDIKKENEEMKVCVSICEEKTRLIEELKNTRERLAEVTECYAESLRERDELKKKLDEKSHLVDIYGARLNTKDTMIKKLNETNEDLANKLAAERAKVETRTEEIDKLVKENEELRKSVDILSDGIDHSEKETMDLHNEIGIHIRCYNELKNNIEKMGFTVTKDNEVITTLHKPHIMSALEYAEHDLEMTKKVAEHYKSLMETTPIVITKSEESTIRPFNELPYVRYARHIHMKYKALTDSGFSHDDAMGLIPMWDDNEFEGFKRMEE